MIIDNFLKMCDTLTVGSSTAAVTDYIDTLAEGDDYAGLFAVFHVETAILSGTSDAKVTFKLQHSDTTAATAYEDLVSSGEVDDATTVAGYLEKLRIPPVQKRYIRGVIQTTETATYPANYGEVSVFLAKDVDINAHLRA
jgi:hypothetical protein